MVQEQPSRVERRLLAILAADVAGYSRLMHNDEEATHGRLTKLLSEAVEPSMRSIGPERKKYWRRVPRRISECSRGGSGRNAIPKKRP